MKQFYYYTSNGTSNPNKLCLCVLVASCEQLLEIKTLLKKHDVADV